MTLNAKCPRCGSTNTRLVQVKSHHHILWFLFFGWAWLAWWILKVLAAGFVLVYFDWWYALIMKNRKKEYVWLSKRILSTSHHYFYCNKCHNNFKVSR